MKYSKAERIILVIVVCSLCVVGHLLWEQRTDEAGFYEVEMNVSAYCICSRCCGQFADGITASGVPAVGKMIAAPKTYAFKTKMDIPGYGTALVQDRGGAIKGNKLDLLFESHQSALNWGRKTLTVKVYK